MEQMERGNTTLTQKAYYNQKIKRAAQLLMYKRHMKPGIKGWELKTKLGSDYQKTLQILDEHLEKLGLQIKTVFEAEQPIENPTVEDLNKARFFVAIIDGVPEADAKMMGWRIDDVAGLAAAISHIIAKKGKAPREEVSDLLRTKLPGWRVDMNINRFIKAGYLGEDENGQLYLDWRTRAEVNEKELVELLLK
jgi:hypothetical protein